MQVTKCVQKIAQLTVLVTIFALSFAEVASADYKILINHLTTDLSGIPLTEITSAKANLHIAYNHTSHGSQLISGMNALENYAPFGTTYEWSDSGSSGLDLDDNGIPGIPDLSQGDYIDINGVTPWVTSTRALLDNSANDHINVIMWSWCDIGGHDIPRYLTHMEILISEYSEGGTEPRAATNPVTFVFMTGHANGDGENDSSDSRNQQIRQHCSDNNRVLFDFADIENYDPNYVYYLDKRITDDLDYDNSPPYDDGGRDGNWAVEYIAANPGSELAALTSLCTSCSHSADSPQKTLNCVLKGRAAWWMYAMINGWSGGICTPAPSGLTATADSAAGEIALSWTDNSTEEDSYIVQRQVNGGTWDTGYQTLVSNATTYTDSSLSPGVYNYRVIAHRNDDGSGSPCNSSYSNSDSAEILSLDPPDAAPTILSLSVNHTLGQISLTWVDNSTNEENFIIQRRVEGGVWNNSFASTGADVETYDDTGLTAGTYYYRVVASNTYGVSAASNEENESVLATPAAPTALSATGNVGAGTVQLGWTDNASDETGYRVQRQVDGGSWDDNYENIAVNSVAYLDNNKGAGPLPSGTYAFRVVAVNGAILSAPSNVDTVVLSTTVPAAPTAIDSTITGNDITVSWTDNSDNEDSFVLERNVNGGSWIVYETLAADTNSYLDAGLMQGMTYSYRVKATNSFGDSAYSGVTGKFVGSSTTTVRLQTTAEVDDAFIYTSAPDTNYGSTNYRSVIERFAIKFNLPAEVLNKRIVEARITFYGWNITIPSSPPQYLDLYPIDLSWDEMGVTWNNAASGTPWTIAGGDFATPAYTQVQVTDVDHDFFPPADITGLVQQWADGSITNNGFMVINDSLATVGLKASEYNNDQRSYLEITYAPAVPGDVNDDGAVDFTDIIVSLQMLCEASGSVTFTTRADVNGDGKIGLAETVFILRALAGL